IEDVAAVKFFVSAQQIEKQRCKSRFAEFRRDEIVLRAEAAAAAALGKDDQARWCALRKRKHAFQAERRQLDDIGSVCAIHVLGTPLNASPWLRSRPRPAALNPKWSASLGSRC